MIALAGCGGGGHSQAKPEHRSQGGEDAERVQAVRGIRPADLTAFYQVALADGRLRQWGATRGRGRTDLRETATRLRHLHPVDRRLVRAGRQARAGVREALAARHPSRAEARRALSRADRLRTLIDRIVRRDPRFSALMPD
jgi:hypothetical protein